MQPESELDDVWDAFAGRALALLVLERVGVAACGKEAVLEMILTDDAEMLWRRPAWCACASRPVAWRCRRG